MQMTRDTINTEEYCIELPGLLDSRSKTEWLPDNQPLIEESPWPGVPTLSLCSSAFHPQNGLNADAAGI
ncbi:hypothetical protein TWF569_000539 [Orbilia oligospora]|uniref:Uncharacterized protein n=1 Tax=Orbilia oligospora TaxID=2813651 RepID=A0A7C8JJI8_ORBOL|nr:hypothetical protein TWF102_004267 [Orbilia oligospora]KAF3117802.1 hypothetical protein TWF103_004476 [Orbilia oligospora]KAF3126462.1 hypothetical protein TWF569_000539 [Orbilia oligospora]KAF3151908.1 hypothetical protein TWF594_005668 [Orbilia oligospora]